ncbi:MAG TPA: hypothetical protein VLI54_03615 [Bacillota bacterium]|nr:hypothetical protein [Bacillota bacterium]
MTEITVSPFTTAELGMLQDKAGEAFIDWALMQPSVRPDTIMRDAAAVHTWLRIEQAQCHYGAFNKGTKRRVGMESRYRGRTLAQYAGAAASHLAASRLVATWYGLEQTDIQRVPAASSELRVIASNCEILEPTIGRLPQALGIVSLNTYDISAQAMQRAETAAIQQGPTAAAPYFDFPQFPDWTNFNPIPWGY